MTNLNIKTDMAALMKTIKAVVYDFDGVFTDNRVIVFEDGREAVICNRSDGFGLSRLRSLGIEMAIISTETNPVISKRAEKLNIACFQGVEDKAACLREFARDKNVDLKRVAFVGNDINDEECLRIVGLPVVVADAAEEVKSCARLVLSRRGGDAVVREFCDMLWRIKRR